MNHKRARPLIALGVGVIALIAAASAGANAASDAPSYYVDGARPAKDADAQTTAGCVPWSPSREDVNVCGPLPQGWAPPAAPHYDAAICEAARAILVDRRASLATTWGFVPEVDASTCTVTGRANGHDWFVLFNLTNGRDEAGSYSRALVLLDADGEIRPMVSLA